ncbi:MAG: hypothetical protein FJ222_10850 [Lentisphaerae bacterium]|nr:hypothetical protein [Lentisphaerota bacterium]
MLMSVQAILSTTGEIHLLEPVHVGHSCRAIVTIFDAPDVSETALLSQEALAHDWERPEEDVAWAHLQ